MQREGSKQRHIQSVARALGIMNFIGEAGRPVSLSDLGRGLGLSLGTLHGIITTLKHYDFIRQDPETDKYFLGFSLWRLGGKVPEGFDKKRVILSHMHQLCDHYGETVHLAILSEGEALYLDKVEGKQTYRLTSRVGERRPLHCCSIGKAMLAHQTPDACEALLSSMKLAPVTPYSITSMTKFRAHLENVRKQGYALDSEETEIGLCGVGAPLRDHTGEVIAAISVAMPAHRYNERGGDVMGPYIREAALRISIELGFEAGLPPAQV